MNLDIPHNNSNIENYPKSSIEKKSVQFDNTENIEKQEKYLKDQLNQEIIDFWFKEKYPKWVDVKNIDSNVFIVINKHTDTPTIFIDKKWEVLISLLYRANEFLIKDNPNNWNPWRAMLKSGFVFWPKLELHKIVWYENGQLIINWKIDTYSKEYYQAWKKIIYNSWKLEIKFNLQSNDKIPYNHNWIEALLDSWAMTKEVLDQFNKKWIVTQEDYEYWLDYLEKQNRKSVDRAIEDIKNRVK